MKTQNIIVTAGYVSCEERGNIFGRQKETLAVGFEQKKGGTDTKLPTQVLLQLLSATIAIFSYFSYFACFKHVIVVEEKANCAP